MDWLSTKKLLDQVASDILATYKEYLFVQGLYPHVINNYPEKKAEEDADYFIEMKHFPDEYFEEEGSLEDIHNKYGEDADIVRHLLWRREGGGKFTEIDSVKRLADKVIADKALDIPEADYELFCLKVAEMLSDLKYDRENLVKRLKNGDESFASDRGDCDYGNGHGHKQLLPQLSEEQKPSLTFKELIDGYVEYKINKQRWSDITLRGKKQSLETFHEIFQFIKKSETVYLNQLTVDDANRFEELLRKLPKNRKKVFKEHTIADLVRMERKGEISAKHYISNKTYNDLCTLLTSMMQYAVEPRQGYMECNFFTDLKIKVRDAVEREPFTNHELQLFFNTDLFVEKKIELQYAWRYWIPVFMLYHGVRLEEVAQPFLKDIQEVEGIWCLKVEKKPKNLDEHKQINVKNDNSVRLIPLHNKLIKLGFLDYIRFLDGKGEVKLFPTLSRMTPKGQYAKHGKKVTTFFNEDSGKEQKHSYLTKCGIRSADTPERTKALTCFRHTVQKILNDHPSNVISDKIDQLFGHSPRRIGKKHYSRFSVSTIQEMVNMIDYPEAHLPWDVDEKYYRIPFSWE